MLTLGSQELEGGIEVTFYEGKFNTGDYWLIPARTATSHIEWPKTTDSSGKIQPEALPPKGIEHHYCCLAIVAVAQQSTTASSEGAGSAPALEASLQSDCRCLFPSLCQLQEAAAETALHQTHQCHLRGRIQAGCK